MAQYTYKRQTAEDIKLSEENEKAVQEFLELMANDIRKTVKELKDAGYTDEQINQGFNQATAQLFYGVQSYRPGGICTNANPCEVVLDTQKIKEALGI